jgi:hypothetical protein
MISKNKDLSLNKGLNVSNTFKDNEGFIWYEEEHFKEKSDEKANEIPNLILNY